jgi:hypothetical protein
MVKKKFRGSEEFSQYLYECLDDIIYYQRGTLAKKYNSLYVALRRYDQLDKFFPNYDKVKSFSGQLGGKTPSLNKHEVELILYYYSKCEGNPSIAASVLPYTADRIRRTWRKKGLQTIGSGNWQRSKSNRKIYKSV